jgi:hypothetical protein
MTMQAVCVLRMTLGLTTAVAVSYGLAWPLNFVGPLFAAIFLFFPAWIGWKMAVQLLLRLAFALLTGLIISEFFLNFPLLCVPLYGLLFFFIYFNDTPTAPPMAAMFMTLGITMVPIMGLSGVALSHLIVVALLFNMAAGLFFAWLFHTIIPNSLASPPPQAKPAAKAAPPPVPPRLERARLALVSTLVALTAVIIFFAFNLSSYAYAMIQICLMAGAPSANASFQSMKNNAVACLIGGMAIVIVYNLLIAVPTYLFLVSITLCSVLLFSRKIYSGSPLAKAWFSGLTTFLVLLGTSTMANNSASANFYLRIAQILFAGLFTVAGLIVVERLLRPVKKQLLPAGQPKK